MYVYIYVCIISICILVNRYVYTYIYIYMYICIYKYMRHRLLEFMYVRRISKKQAQFSVNMQVCQVVSTEETTDK